MPCVRLDIPFHNSTLVIVCCIGSGGTKIVYHGATKEYLAALFLIELLIQSQPTLQQAMIKTNY